jgi:hypothetical protein
MALIVENAFVNITLAGEATMVAQHQSKFPGNVIARWTILGQTWVKVPFTPGDTKPLGSLTTAVFRSTNSALLDSIT